MAFRSPFDEPADNPKKSKWIWLYLWKDESQIFVVKASSKAEAEKIIMDAPRKKSDLIVSMKQAKEILANADYAHIPIDATGVGVIDIEEGFVEG